uniref:RING-type E3 ubiquitin transferase n=1 Tax=Kalanchoe fedtschenkoi TaxID=63787 RepID=A0A7N0UKC2_KALFE
MASSSQADNVTVTDAPNKGYELSGKIMLSAIVILFAVVIFMVCLHLYARWYLLRARRRQLQRRNRSRRRNIVFYVDSAAPAASRGLDPSVLNSIPVFVFSGDSDQKAVAECAVCLSEFEDGEKGRSLPKCNHSFHIDCIDMWFHSHSTCPLCRAPVEPVAEVANSNVGNHVVVVDSASQAEPRAILVPTQDGMPEATTASSSSSSGASRNTQLEIKGFVIEIPRRHDLAENDSSTNSPQAIRTPGGRLMSLRRILTRGLSMSSPNSAGIRAGGGECCDLEIGNASREPNTTQSLS